MPKTKLIESHDHTHAQNRFAVIPTAKKLNADTTLTGRNVTVAFLDSGFYPHPDFANRVVAFYDVTGDERSLSDMREPRGHHWHGMQTVVSCAGDGSLSDGTYRGLASDAKLVLVKVSKNGRIGDESIEKGLRWLIKNREKYNIRVLNMSLGGDADLPTHESCVNQLTEELIASGVVVTVAAGNSAESRSIPPANAPSVITVGGYSDENQFAAENFDLYHSSFGVTADGLVKPEIIAPAMYVAAPILPETTDYDAAETLSMLAAAPNYQFRPLLVEFWKDAGLEPDVISLDDEAARRHIEAELVRRKIVATHYQHVDGTSFAAPITASVAAQMLEANPNLTPATVKNILISTATKLAGHPRVRQGFGVLNAGLATLKARDEGHFLDCDTHFPPRVEGRQILFSYHDDDAQSVALCGDFNAWRKDQVMFERTEHGLWRAAIPCQPAGQYRYKFLVDGNRWTEDPSHGLKGDDGVGGFNSIFSIG
ncbi:MAG: S8 family serine peptidase [Pyrinomonadaceae bacterium]